MHLPTVTKATASTPAPLTSLKEKSDSHITGSQELGLPEKHQRSATETLPRTADPCWWLQAACEEPTWDTAGC